MQKKRPPPPRRPFKQLGKGHRRKLLSSQGCAAAREPVEKCSSIGKHGKGYDNAMRAYYNASATGIMRIDECVFSRKGDGLCAATMI